MSSRTERLEGTALEGAATAVGAILGIDAAWTVGRPSGVALLEEQGGRWHCVALAPSYAQFEGLAAGTMVDWQARPPGSAPDLAALLAASRELLDGKSVQVIAVDMPLSLEPIRRRRAADAAVSRAFGAQGCAVHSPSAERPGALADRLRAAAENLGYPLATAATPAGQTPALLEVYPHPALLRLLDARYRLPYKVTNRRKYWPDATPAERLARVLQQLDEIRCALQRAVDGVPLDAPPLADIASAASLKAIEDALDALVCGWVGTRYLAGRCRAYGDDTAAIWIPTADEEQRAPWPRLTGQQRTRPGAEDPCGAPRRGQRGSPPP